MFMDDCNIKIDIKVITFSSLKTSLQETTLLEPTFKSLIADF